MLHAADAGFEGRLGARGAGAVGGDIGVVPLGFADDDLQFLFRKFLVVIIVDGGGDAAGGADFDELRPFPELAANAPVTFLRPVHHVAGQVLLVALGNGLMNVKIAVPGGNAQHPAPHHDAGAFNDSLFDGVP